MRSVFTCTTLAIIVPLVFSQRPLAHYPENLKRAVPHHYKNDQENTHRGLDKIARWHKIEPPFPRLRPHQTVPWLRWVQGRWAAPADKNTELHKVRAHLLEEKLKPNHLVFKPHINPQLKPKLNKKENVRTKREVGKTEKETPQKETHVEVNVRHKRDLMMPQLVPEMVLQPHIQANIPQPRDQFEGEIKESEKREKRQILYFINRPPKLLARSPRTTPNPFIRDTHIEEYDIIRPEVGEREGMIPTIESGSSDLGSYPLVNEESTEFSKIVSQFYLTTSYEYWPEIQKFADNILNPLSKLMAKKRELNKALENVKDAHEKIKRIEEVPKYFADRNKTSYVDEESSEEIHQRVKRRVNKTLQRKRAKKKKQRLRRFERKRLRMLTHARRVRKQQKSKQARLQRHYARMNMSTTETPDHLRNQTLVDEAKDQSTYMSTNKDDEEEVNTDEEDEEYESSEYEDESEGSESGTKEKSKGETEQEESEESDKSDDETEVSESGSKPDNGNDDYETYEDEGDEDDYEDYDSSEEESEKKERKGKKPKAVIKNGSRKGLKMSSRRTFSKQNENQRNFIGNQNSHKSQTLNFLNKNTQLNAKTPTGFKRSPLKNNHI